MQIKLNVGRNQCKLHRVDEAWTKFLRMLLRKKELILYEENVEMIPFRVVLFFTGILEYKMSSYCCCFLISVLQKDRALKSRTNKGGKN